jgi:carbonic anhydrase/acetyltransferase-like protein (isoleucine patch superfamily)
MIQRFKDFEPQLGEDAFVHPAAVVIGQISLGARASVWPNVTMRADEGPIVIGEDSNIQDGSTVHMTGGWTDTHVGARCTVGHNVILHGCTIGDDCLIGMGSIILDGVTIGAGSFVGAGSLIPPNKTIPPNSFVMGNPYRVIRECGDRERTWIKGGWAHYVVQAAAHRASLAAMGPGVG